MLLDRHIGECILHQSYHSMRSAYHKKFGNELLSLKTQNFNVKLNIFPFGLPTWLKSTNYNSLSASKRDFLKNHKGKKAWVVVFNSFSDFFSWMMAPLEIHFNSFRNIQSPRIKRVFLLGNLCSS